MKFKQFGCSLLMFLAGVIFLFITIVWSNQHPETFWWGIGALVAACVALSFVLRFIKKKQAEQAFKEAGAEAAETADAPLVMVEKIEDKAVETEKPAEPAPAIAAEPAKAAEPALKTKAEPAAPVTAPEGSSLMETGTYAVGTDIPAGKYDFRALRGSGTLTVTADDGTVKAAVLLGTLERQESVEYRNLICDAGDTLTIAGGLTVAVRKSRMIVID